MVKVDSKETSDLGRVVPDFERFDRVFSRLALSGYTIATGIRNVTPEFSLTTYPVEWMQHYVDRRYAWLDPVIQFAAFRTGTKRWSELTTIKLPVLSTIIMERAGAFGLKYGLVIVKKDALDGTRKHLLSLARADREFTDPEIELAAATFDALIEALAKKRDLTARQLQMLTLFANGKTRSEVAQELGVSDETIKKDADSVRRMWGAKNTTEAVGLAIARKVINPYSDTKW